MSSHPFPYLNRRRSYAMRIYIGAVGSKHIPPCTIGRLEAAKILRRNARAIPCRRHAFKNEGMAPVCMACSPQRRKQFNMESCVCPEGTYAQYIAPKLAANFAKILMGLMRSQFHDPNLNRRTHIEAKPTELAQTRKEHARLQFGILREPLKTKIDKFTASCNKVCFRKCINAPSLYCGWALHR